MDVKIDVNTFDVINERDPGGKRGIQVSKRAPSGSKKMPKQRKQAPYDKKRAIFGKAASILNGRGFKVVNDVPEFYYVTKNAMVCPPLDGLESSEIYAFEAGYDCIVSQVPFSNRLKQMVPVEHDEENNLYHSEVLVKVANFLN